MAMIAFTVISADAARALLTFPRTNQKVGHLQPVPFQAKGFPHPSELFAHLRKCGPWSEKAGSARELRPLEWFSVDEWQQFWINPHQRPHPSGEWFQGVFHRVCLSEDVQQDGAWVPRSGHLLTSAHFPIFQPFPVQTHHSHTVLPDITPQINCLHQSHCVRVCFWGNSNHER